MNEFLVEIRVIVGFTLERAKKKRVELDVITKKWSYT